LDDHWAERPSSPVNQAKEATMMFNRDFENLAALARERQADILHASSSATGRRPGSLWSLGVVLAVVCAPLAALFFLRVW
jgi:hypothetical protein